jgi:hypothetical protein
MRINQALAEQTTQSTLRTSYGVVPLPEASETTIRQETQISIVIIEARQGIKGNTVQRDERGGREYRLFEERYPVETVIIGHDSLSYSIPLQTTPPLYRRYDSQIGSIKRLAGRGNHGKEEDERWIRKRYRNTNRTPREHVQANEAIRVTEEELLEAQNKGSMDRTHRRGITRNFRIPIHANMIRPMREEPTRAMQM